MNNELNKLDEELEDIKKNVEKAHKKVTEKIGVMQTIINFFKGLFG